MVRREMPSVIPGDSQGARLRIASMLALGCGVLIALAFVATVVDLELMGLVETYGLCAAAALFAGLSVWRRERGPVALLGVIVATSAVSFVVSATVVGFVSAVLTGVLMGH